MANLWVSTVNISAPDPRELGRFYQRLLGGELVADEPGWVMLRTPRGVPLAFQEEHFTPPTWPAQPGDQHMMLHLEVQVDDLDEAVTHAVECGARLADFQPQDDVRVCLDPAGHPFCLWVAT